MKHSAPTAKMIEHLYVRYARGHTPEAQQYLSSMMHAPSLLTKLEQLASTRNPMETDASHARRIHQAAQKAAAEGQRVAQRLAEQANASREQLLREINAAANLTPPKDAAEIRSVIRALPPSERLKAMNDAAARGHADIIAALMEGNSVTTGVDDENRSRFIEMHKQRSAPELYQRLEALEESIGITPKVLDIVQQATNEATNESYIAEITAMEEKAQAAQQDFDAQLTTV